MHILNIRRLLHLARQTQGSLAPEPGYRCRHCSNQRDGLSRERGVGGVRWSLSRCRGGGRRCARREGNAGSPSSWQPVVCWWKEGTCRENKVVGTCWHMFCSLTSVVVLSSTVRKDYSRCCSESVSVSTRCRI
eukprot:552460-Hanusia_phi.AAC.1